MNIVIRAIDGLWSLVCMLATGGLIGLFLYWVFIQQPYLTYNVEEMVTEYSAPSGSLLYVENPLFPPNAVTQMELVAELTNEEHTYRLAPLPGETLGNDKPVKFTIPQARAGYPIYPIFIPSYVQPGNYKYDVVVSYKLNPFRTALVELPTLSINIY